MTVCSTMLEIFCKSAVSSAVHFASVCWRSGIRADDINKLNKLSEKLTVDPFKAMVERRSLIKHPSELILVILCIT